MFVAFGLAALLGSGSLVGLAERQDVGTTRDVALSTARAVDRVANFFALNRPVDWANRALHGETEEIDLAAVLASREATAGAATSPTPSPSRTPRPTPSSIADATAQIDGWAAAATPTPAPTPTDGVTPTPTPTPTVSPPPAPTPTPELETLREVTEDEPLRLYVAGDSLSRDLGEGIARVAPVDLVEPVLDSRASSGLTRDDFFDWPQRITRRLLDDPPDAVVIMFGANDYQGIRTAGATHQAGSPEWVEEYSDRVGLTMDLLAVEGLSVTWVGLPIMRPGVYRRNAIEQLNEIYRTEADERWWVDFVDVYQLFADEQGAYTEFIDGTDMRAADGVHLTHAGSDRIAEVAWEVIGKRWAIEPDQ